MAFVKKEHLTTFMAAIMDNLIKYFVKKEDGKGLSSCDYTAEDKEKLGSMPANYITSGSQTEESLEDGGVNVYTFTMADGNTSEFTVRNGSKGKDGVNGKQGEKGDKGDTGAQGIPGEKGEKGDPGDKGETGATGEKGEKGDPGEKGEKGDKGDKGDTGAQGPRGLKGDTGATGATGQTGATGPQGATGAAAGFGTPTATVDANVGTPSVTVEASGPSTAKVFKFIFKNLKGATGATGAKGATGATGTRGSRWNVGTAVTGTSTTATVFSGTGITDSLVGDMYFNTSTCNVYKCTVAGAAAAAKWVYVGCLKGATGAAGKNATTTAVATTAANGLMGKEMVTKLNKAAQGEGLTFSVVNGILTITY